MRSLVLAVVIAISPLVSQPAFAADFKTAKMCNDERRDDSARIKASGISLHDFIDACWHSKIGEPTPLKAEVSAEHIQKEEKKAVVDAPEANPALRSKRVEEAATPITFHERRRPRHSEEAAERSRSRSAAKHRLIKTASLVKRARAYRTRTSPAAAKVVLATSELGTLWMSGQATALAQGRFELLCLDSNVENTSTCLNGRTDTISAHPL